MLVVELDKICLLHHVATDCGIMSVANYFHPEQQPSQWVCEPNANRVNEHISWHHGKCLIYNLLVSD